MKEKLNLRETYERMAVIKNRMTEMADALENDKEREAFTEAETAEMRDLQRELTILQSRALASTIVVDKQSNVADINKQLREAISKGEQFAFRVSRAVASDFGGDASGYADPATSTNPAPVTIGDIVEPLIPKTILGTIGVPLLTNLKGNYMYPVVEAFEATINDEAAELGDTKIPLNKLLAKPERIGLAVPVTREAITETNGLIQSVCTEWMPVAVAALMNKIMFATEKVTGATNLVGPFVNLASGHKIEGDISLKSLLNLKGVVMNENVQGENLCYVCNHTTLGILEATPAWEGSCAKAICEDGKIAGIPVFATSLVPDNTVLFGDWKYAPQGIFGDISFVVDPYTLARKNAVDFVLNMDYAITTLREEAFAMLSFQGE